MIVELEEKILFSLSLFLSFLLSFFFFFFFFFFLPKKATTMPFHCEECGEVLHGKKEHKEYHQEQMCITYLNGESFEDGTQMKTLSRVKRIDDKGNEWMVFVCPICELIFRIPSGLRMHWRSKHDTFLNLPVASKKAEYVFFLSFFLSFFLILFFFLHRF
jgi:hypothetical protein